MNLTLPESKLSLKQIVENIDAISEKFGQTKPPLSLEMKNQLKEMAYMFNEYGKAFQDEQTIMDSVKAVSEFMNLAEQYAVNECGDVFQENIIKQNFQEAAKKVQQLQKIAQEAYVRKQQCAVLFDDIRHVVNRYYRMQQEQYEGESLDPTVPENPVTPATIPS